MKVRDHQGYFHVLIAHMPSKENELDATYSKLPSIEVNRLSNSQRNTMVLIGDFNAHLGKDLLGEKSLRHLGAALLHRDTNDAGRYLMDFILQFKMKVNTTFGRHNAIDTWKRGRSISQLNHIMTSLQSSFFVDRIRGIYLKRSDHKLVSARIIFREVPSTMKRSNNAMSIEQSSLSSGLTPAKADTSKMLRWDMTILKDEEKCTAFQHHLSLERKKVGTLINWSQLSNLITQVSNF